MAVHALRPSFRPLRLLCLGRKESSGRLKGRSERVTRHSEKAAAEQTGIRNYE